MQKQNHSQVILKNPQENNLGEFYMLHYPQKNNSEELKKSVIGFRSKSVITTLEKTYQQQISTQKHIKYKNSVREKQKIKNKSLSKIQKDKNKAQKFLYKNVLSSQLRNQQLQSYFAKFPRKTEIDLEQYSRKNVGVRMAVQRCKDEKLKIQKVISSVKQSQQTKLDYLKLKRKDLEDEINDEIKVIYDEFFKKQYQQTYGQKGLSEFEERIQMTLEILHQQMFPNK